MKKSESFKAVMTALGDFQAECVKIRKDSTNPHFKSKYASLSAILDEIQPVLSKHKLVFTQTPEGNKSLTTLLCHAESGEWIEADYELSTSTITPQGIGSAITYARRYSLTSILGLNIDDDDDGNAAMAAPPQGKQQTNSTPAQQAPPAQAQQQSQPQTPFNKKYSDTKAIEAAISTATAVINLNELYLYNKELFDGHMHLQNKIKAKKTTIENIGKPIVTDAQVKQVCARIMKGDTAAYDSSMGAFIMNEAQVSDLRTALGNYKALDAALTIKHEKPGDIADLIIQCNTEQQVLKLHSANNVMIDSDVALQGIIGTHLKALKKAA